MSEEDAGRVVATPVALAQCDEEGGSGRALKARGAVPFEDGYEGYLDDTVGLTYAGLDELDVLAAQRARSLKGASIAELEALDLATLDGASLWFAALAWRGHGHEDEFSRLVERILQDAADDPVIDAAALHAYHVHTLIGRGATSRAKTWLERLRARPDSARAHARLSGLLEASTGNEASARASFERWEELVDSDPDELFELAEDLWELRRADLARAWLTRAEEVAIARGERTLLVDVALLRRELHAAPHAAVSAALEAE